MNKNPMRIWILLVATVLLLVGCSCNNTKPGVSPTPKTTSTVKPTATMEASMEPSMEPSMNPSTSPEASPGAMSGEQTDPLLSAQASEAVSMMSELKSAAVVINADTALVGLEYDPQYSGGITERLKTAIEEKIKTVAPEVKNLYCTDDPDQSEQIKKLLDKLEGGSTWTELQTEFDTLMEELKQQDTGA